MACAYLSYPDGPDGGDLEERQDNIHVASLWMDFLVDVTPWGVICPWLQYSMLGKRFRGERVQDSLMDFLRRCDVLLQAGPSIAEGDTAAANAEGMPIIDLTSFGRRPPWQDRERDGLARHLRWEYDRLRSLKPRRAWVPPLTDAEIDALRVAQRRLQYDKSPDAAQVIARILQAALKP